MYEPLKLTHLTRKRRTLKQQTDSFQDVQPSIDTQTSAICFFDMRGFLLSSFLFLQQAAAATAAAAAAATVSPLGSSSLFGTGGLAFQLGVGQNEDSDGDFETDPDLIMVSEIKSSSYKFSHEAMSKGVLR